MFSLIFLLGMLGWFGAHSQSWECVGADPARACGRIAPVAPLVPGADISPRNGLRFGVDFNAIKGADHAPAHLAD